MKEEDRLKAYQGMAETSRKWITVLDAKAGFVSGINGLILGLIWGWAKLPQHQGIVGFFATSGSVLLFVSVVIALSVVVPRYRLSQVFSSKIQYTGEARPVSFYGFVAAEFPLAKADRFLKELAEMTFEDFCAEAIEQHFTMSHLAAKKSKLLLLAASFQLAAIFLTIIAVVALGF
jgi:hypothetical protein